MPQLEQTRLNISQRSRTSRLPWRGQFSPELVEYLIDAVCPDSVSILDPFCGSGTVLFEASEKGKHAVGIEVNPAAWHLACLSSFASLGKLEKTHVLDQLDDLIVQVGYSLTDLWKTDFDPFSLIVRIADTHSSIFEEGFCRSCSAGNAEYG